MIIDIILVIIFILSLILGYRKGFTNSLIHTFGWVGSIVVSYLVNRPVCAFLKDNTGLYDYLYESVKQNVAASADTSTSLIPTLFGGILLKAQEELAVRIADSIYAVICFLLVLFAIKIILWLIALAVSKKHNDGVIGFVDGLLGMLAGIIRGIIIVLLLLAFAYPVLSFISPDTAELMMKQLESSMFSLYLYEHNPLLVILELII